MRVLFMLIAMLFTAQAFATGKISGKITDEKTGDALIGATVAIKNTSKGTATDVDGNFMLTVEPGTYVVIVNYIGYQQKEIEDVVVTEGQLTSVNVAISESSSTQLEEVVVRSTLKKENISALYIMQKNSIAVSSGISADIIQRSPDRNTGEVLKRVSGASVKDNKYVIIRGLSDRYNIALVNNALMPSTEPDKKAFSFDVIPSNIIDNIIINKTASPDKPGDFAGGIIQVLTKDVPETDFFNIGIAATYNTQTTFKDFTATERSGSEYLGFAPEGTQLPSAFKNTTDGYKRLSLQEQVGAAKQLSNNYVETTTSALPNTSIQLSGGKAFNTKSGGKFGTILGLTYRNSQTIAPDFIRGRYEATPRVSQYNTETQYKFSTILSGLANFSYVKGKSRLSFKNLYNRIYDNNYYRRDGYNTSFNQQIKAFSSIPMERQIYSTQLEGEHAFGSRNIKLNWNLNYSSLQADQNDLRTAFYSRNATFDNDDNLVADESLPFEIVDRNSRRFFGNQTDNNYGGTFDITVPFQMSGKNQTFKAGYLGSYKDRDFAMRIFQYDFRGTSTSPERHFPVSEIFAPANIDVNKFTLTEITSKTDEYIASGLLNAGFAMLDNSFGTKWRLIWGVRFESYTQNLQATTLSNEDIDKTDVFNDVLPSVNLSYDVSEKIKLRLSGSRTVNRPEFREIAPFQFIDFENLWTISGNPNLKRGNINNVDFRYEYYPSPGEAITAGIFYKNFENPIEVVMNEQSNLDLFVFGYQNAKSANAVGIELEARKNLSFLGSKKWLDNLTLGGNVSYIYSKVSNLVGKSNIIGTKTERPLQGQSPYIVNLSLLYNDVNKGWAVSAMYNRIGHRIVIVGSSSIPTTWENGRNVVDLQVSKAVINKRGELKLTVGDLLNQVTTFYWNTNDADSYQKGDSKKGTGNDQVFQQSRLGTSVTLGFTYNLTR